MSLNVAKLEKVRELAGGIVQARCPACAEGGNDRSGEHLRIYPDGRFGCCVHPKDGEHRKRIFALVGVRKPGNFSLRLNTPSALPATQSVKAALTGFTARTVRTPFSESVTTEFKASQVSQDSDRCQTDLQSKYFRTVRTAFLHPYAYAREDTTNIDTPVYMCKDLASAVLPVLAGFEGKAGPTPSAAPCGEPPLRLPFLTAGGDLSIPFDSPVRYHWWRGGQSVAETLLEVKERMKNAIAV
jgi:hypothetical protein